MRILLDSGIFSHSEFAEATVKPTRVHWDGRVHDVPVHGLVRKEPDTNAEQQEQEEALFTIGRLIREGRILAYEYSEIHFEGVRIGARIQEFNALRGCTIHRCASALERSRFRTTTDLRDMISKGGKKDRKAGVDLGEANQIAFFEWLYHLRK